MQVYLYKDVASVIISKNVTGIKAGGFSKLKLQLNILQICQHTHSLG